jgi:hypothetical protein
MELPISSAKYNNSLKPSGYYMYHLLQHIKTLYSFQSLMYIIYSP